MLVPWRLWRDKRRFPRRNFPLVLLLCLSVIVPASCRDQTSSIKLDEEVLFFPGFAVEAGLGWTAHVHGWIFEPERDGTALTELERLLLARLEVPKAEFDPLRFRERTRLFFVDNERSKEISIDVSGRSVTLAPSEANGHFEDRIAFEESGHPTGGWIGFRALTRPGDSRVFSGQIQLIGRKGISVVSDIDDTIKDSNVLVRRELIANTFGREFRAVPGMADLYEGWAKQSKAVFHYVSGSPWQLYPSLSDFAQRAGFPPGSFHLRQFRLKDKSAVEFLENRTLEFKLDAIDRLMRLFPERRFVLVGDSGELDPEVYAQLATRFPGQVVAILIRDVRRQSLDSPRFIELFKSVPPSIDRRVFRSTSELADFRLP
jgi:uncharacterized protein DUF2183